MLLELQITSIRFIIRQLTVKDVSYRYLEWLQDDTVQKIIYGAAPNIKLNDLKRYVSGQEKNPSVLFLGVFCKESGKHIGNIKFDPIGYEKNYTVMGILIGEKEWRGKGVAKEVITSTFFWINGKYNITKMVLGVDKSHKSAIKAYKKIGFKAKYNERKDGDADDGNTIMELSIEDL
jgi:[ribosomal protein S5]-alanine N-acetyltransferase